MRNIPSYIASTRKGVSDKSETGYRLHQQQTCLGPVETTSRCEAVSGRISGDWRVHIIFKRVSDLSEACPVVDAVLGTL